MSGPPMRVEVVEDMLTGLFIARARWYVDDGEYGAKGKGHPTVGAAVYALGDSLCRLQVAHPEWFPIQTKEASRRVV